MAKRKKSKTTGLTAAKAGTLSDPALLADVRQLIAAAREQTARIVNTTLVMMYWHIGWRIQADVLKHERAEYGKEILPTVSRQLTEEYGKGFTQKGLWRMVQFAEVFPDEQIAQTLSRQLSWSHFVELIPHRGSTEAGVLRRNVPGGSGGAYVRCGTKSGIYCLNERRSARSRTS